MEWRFGACIKPPTLKESTRERPVPLWSIQKLADPFARLENLLDPAQVGARIGTIHHAMVEAVREQANRAYFDAFTRLVGYHPRSAVHAVDRQNGNLGLVDDWSGDIGTEAAIVGER